jgi:hypothetical protein
MAGPSRLKPGRMGICGGQSGDETVFLLVFHFSPVSIIPQLLHNHLFVTDAKKLELRSSLCR